MPSFAANVTCSPCAVGGFHVPRGLRLGMKISGRNTRVVDCLFVGARKQALWVTRPEARATLHVANSVVIGGAPGDLPLGEDGNGASAPADERR